MEVINVGIQFVCSKNRHDGKRARKKTWTEVGQKNLFQTQRARRKKSLEKRKNFFLETSGDAFEKEKVSFKSLQGEFFSPLSLGVLADCCRKAPRTHERHDG